ncbi:MAG: HAD-IC family P-type ATPase [Thermomicrobiales bacterium]
MQTSTVLKAEDGTETESGALDKTNPETGLTDAEADERRSKGLGNRVRHETSRTYGQIIRDNLFTFINVTLIAVGAVLVILGLPKDALLSSGLAFINAGIGIVQETFAKRRLDQIALLARAKATVLRDGQGRQVDPDDLVVGDILVVRAGDQIMLDGQVVGPGEMFVDESLLTGEADLVEMKAGDPVYAGSFCVSGSASYEAEKVGDDMLASNIAVGARAYRVVLTPLQHNVNQIVRLQLVIAGIFLAMLFISSAVWNYDFRSTVLSAAVVVGIVPPGLFLMITVTYSMAALRLSKHNALIQQTNAVESLSNVDIFCMDKTGTLTANKLKLVELSPINGDGADLPDQIGAFVASATSGTKTSDAIAAEYSGSKMELVDEVPFSSDRKWSAVAGQNGDIGGVFALGAPEMLSRVLAHAPGDPPKEFTDQGLRVLLFASAKTPEKLHDSAGNPALPADLAPKAWLAFEDELRPHSRETLAGFQKAGISLKIISGDNPETVAALAIQAGLSPDARLISGLDLEELGPAEFDEAAATNTIFGRITPEQKEGLVDALRRQGHYVAMTGDGVNDVLSLKKADLGIAMESGSQATRAAADIVLLDDSFNVLPSAFSEGQRIRMGLQGVMSLFLVRVFVVTFIIAFVAVIPVQFPFSPAHMSLLTILTVGIPTFGLALWAHPSTPPRSLIHSLVVFVVPAVLTLAFAGFVVYMLFYFLHEIDLESFRRQGYSVTSAVDEKSVARDALTYLLILAGVALVPFAAPPNKWFAVIEETHHDWRPTILAIAMLPLYAVIVAIRPVRDFFGTTLMSATDYLLISAVAVAWMLALRAAWQYQIFERFFGYRRE